MRGYRGGARPDDVDAVDETGINDQRPEASYVPVLGQIAAGVPITAEESVEDVFPLPRQIVGEGQLFLLRVVGDSMIDAAICDGDWVVVRQQPTAENGEIVAAMLDNEATVKTFKRKDGKVAAAAEPCVRPDRRRPRHRPGQGHRGPAPRLSHRRPEDRCSAPTPAAATSSACPCRCAGLSLSPVPVCPRSCAGQSPYASSRARWTSSGGIVTGVCSSHSWP